jgi:hypothetical protein
MIMISCKWVRSDGCEQGVQKEIPLVLGPSVIYLMERTSRKGEIKPYEIYEITNETVSQR